MWPFIVRAKNIGIYKHERTGRTTAKKTIHPRTQIFYHSYFPHHGIEGNLVRLKNTTAEILIGENYKAELMQIIRGR
jgi:hypothetical protein